VSQGSDDAALAVGAPAPAPATAFELLGQEAAWKNALLDTRTSPPR